MHRKLWIINMQHIENGGAIKYLSVGSESHDLMLAV